MDLQCRMNLIRRTVKGESGVGRELQSAGPWIVCHSCTAYTSLCLDYLKNTILRIRKIFLLNHLDQDGKPICSTVTKPIRVNVSVGKEKAIPTPTILSHT